MVNEDRSNSPLYEQLKSVIFRTETRKYIDRCETERIIDKDTANIMRADLEQQYKDRSGRNLHDLDGLLRIAFSGERTEGHDPEPVLHNLLRGVL